MDGPDPNPIQQLQLRWEQSRIIGVLLFAYLGRKPCGFQSQLSKIFLTKEISNKVRKECTGDALDAQIQSAPKGYPTMFALNMLPDVTSLSDDVTQAAVKQEDQLEKLLLQEWKTKLRVLELQLAGDQKLLQKVADGHDVLLSNALHFLQCQKLLKQAETASKLVELFQHLVPSSLTPGSTKKTQSLQNPLIKEEPFSYNRKAGII